MSLSPLACIAALASLGLGLVVGGPSQASLLVVDFAVAPIAGPLSGQPLNGRFVYDSSIVPVGGTGTVTTGPGGSPLSSFSLDLGDTRFTAGNVAASLSFSNGALSRFRIGETGPQSLSDGTDYFFMDSLFGWGEFKLAGNSTLYGGALTGQQVTPQIDRYAFSIGDPIQSGPLAGQTPLGFFSIDRAIAQPNTLLVDVNDRQNLNALLDFQFSFDGTEHSTATVNLEEIGFDANGIVNQFLIGLGDGVTDFTTTTSGVGDFQLLRLAGGPSLAIYQANGSPGTEIESLFFGPIVTPIGPVGPTAAPLAIVAPPRAGYPQSIQDAAPPPSVEVTEPSALAVLGCAALIALSRGRAPGRRSS